VGGQVSQSQDLTWPRRLKSPAWQAPGGDGVYVYGDRASAIFTQLKVEEPLLSGLLQDFGIRTQRFSPKDLR
jgi:hypothetical protein